MWVVVARLLKDYMYFNVDI